MEKLICRRKSRRPKVQKFLILPWSSASTHTWTSTLYHPLTSIPFLIIHEGEPVTKVCNQSVIVPDGSAVFSNMNLSSGVVPLGQFINSSMKHSYNGIPRLKAASISFKCASWPLRSAPRAALSLCLSSFLSSISCWQALRFSCVNALVDGVLLGKGMISSAVTFMLRWHGSGVSSSMLRKWRMVGVEWEEEQEHSTSVELTLELQSKILWDLWGRFDMRRWSVSCYEALWGLQMARKIARADARWNLWEKRCFRDKRHWEQIQESAYRVHGSYQVSWMSMPSEPAELEGIATVSPAGKRKDLYVPGRMGHRRKRTAL